MAIFTAQSKNAATFTGQSINVASYGAQQKPSTSDSLLLLEDGFYVLLETGDRIILEQSASTGTSWSAQSKS